MCCILPQYWHAPGKWDLFWALYLKRDCFAVVSLAILYLYPFLSTAFMTGLSVTMFATNSDVDRQWLPRPDQNYLAWSFGLAVVSGFFSLFSAMCLLVDSFRIKYDNEKKKRAGSAYMAYKMKPVGTQPQYWTPEQNTPARISPGVCLVNWRGY